MPPRKSIDASTLSAPSGDTPTDTTPAPAPTTKPPRDRTSTASNALTIEDLSLPRSMIQRLAKGVLPPNTQIQRDALLALSKSATMFVSYLANSANDRAVLANKKTVQPKDVLEALGELEFEGFVARSEKELEAYNRVQCTKRNDYRRRVKEEAKAGGEGADGDGDVSVTASMLANLAAGDGQRGEGGANGDVRMEEGGGRDDAEPAAKKMRGVNGLAVREEGDDTMDEDDVDGEDDMEDEIEEEDEEPEDEMEDEVNGDEEDLLEEPDNDRGQRRDGDSGSESD